jgi:hypothetical protein
MLLFREAAVLPAVRFAVQEFAVVVMTDSFYKRDNAPLVL